MQMSPNVSSIAAALAKAQTKMGAAVKDSANPFFKSSYADLGSVVEVCKGPLNENGITILQPTGTDEKGHYVQTMLLHSSGEYISTDKLYLELSKHDMQALGSAITYARRYQLQSLLGIPAVDDDGEAAVGRSSVPKTAAAAPVATVVDSKHKSSSFRRPGQPAPVANQSTGTDGMDL